MKDLIDYQDPKTLISSVINESDIINILPCDDVQHQGKFFFKISPIDSLCPDMLCYLSVSLKSLKVAANKATTRILEPSYIGVGHWRLSHIFLSREDIQQMFRGTDPVEVERTQRKLLTWCNYDEQLSICKSIITIVNKHQGLETRLQKLTESVTAIEEHCMTIYEIRKIPYIVTLWDIQKECVAIEAQCAELISNCSVNYQNYRLDILHQMMESIKDTQKQSDDLQIKICRESIPDFSVIPQNTQEELSSQSPHMSYIKIIINNCGTFFNPSLSINKPLNTLSNSLLQEKKRLLLESIGTFKYRLGKINFDARSLKPSENEHYDALCCPLSHDIMDDPIDIYGHVYDRKSLEKLFSNNDKNPESILDPLTTYPINRTMLRARRTNLQVTEKILQFVVQQECQYAKVTSAPVATLAMKF